MIVPEARRSRCFDFGHWTMDGGIGEFPTVDERLLPAAEEIAENIPRNADNQRRDELDLADVRIFEIAASGSRAEIRSVTSSPPFR